MKLYHYVHCPFCQRVRLLLEAKRIPYESIVLSYADIETPVSLTGKKMLPIMEFDDGSVMDESLEIMLEIEKRFPEPRMYYKYQGNYQEKLEWAASAFVGIPNYFTFVLPYYLDVYQEFRDDPHGAKYFQSSKEQKRGQTFTELKSQKDHLWRQISPFVQNICSKIPSTGFLCGEELCLADCIFVADSTGLRCAPNIDLPESFLKFSQRVEEKAGVFLIE